MLNRRGFLGRLSAGLAAIVVARKLPAAAEPARLPFQPQDFPDPGPPSYRVISAPPWVDASFDGDHLTISPKVGALAAGTYTGAVEVIGWKIPHSIPVSFTVTKRPQRKTKQGRRRG